MGRVDLDVVRKVAIFLPPTLGDCVNHLATLRWLSDGLPGREITALSGGLGLGVLTAFPVEGVRVANRDSALKELWLRGRYDLGVFPYVQNKMVRIAKAGRVRQLAGLRGGKHDDWFTFGVEPVLGQHQVLEVCRQLFEHIGIPCPVPVWDLGVARPPARGGPPRVGFMTGASRADKQWPTAKFLQVAECCQRRGCQIFNFGGLGESGALDSLGAVDYAGTPSDFRTTARTLAQMDLLVTNDTGLMHLAGAVGTRVAAVFMVESPAEYFPPGTGHVLLEGDVPVEAVLDAVKEIVGWE